MFVTAWAAELLVLTGIGLAAFLYVRGLRTIWLRAGTGRGVRFWQAAAFASGVATLGVALVSPLDALSAELFAAHMVQHLLLILVAAPLLVASEPLLPLLWALPRSWRRRAGRLSRRPWFVGLLHTLCRPPIAWLVSAAVLWLWHLPALYQPALRNGGLHAFEHICLLGSALLFWYVLAQQTARRRHRYGAAIVYILTMAFQSSVLGVVLAFSRPWYPAYAATTPLWQLTPAEDQQIAGLIMWIPGGAVYLLALLALIVRWVSAEDAAGSRRERRDGSAKGRLYAAECDSP